MTQNQFDSIARKFALLPPEQQRLVYRKMRESGVDMRQLPIPPRTQASAQDGLPLSYAQLGQWLLWRMEPASSAYHIGTALKLCGALDAAALRESFQALIGAHESLRTVFDVDGQGLPYQRVLAQAEPDFVQENLGEAAPALQQALLEARCAQLARQPFDLGTGPLLRVRLFRLADDVHVLAIVMHHIVSDAWSLQLIVNALVDQYRARATGVVQALESAALQYADHALWQKSWLDAGESERQLAYWRDTLGNDSPLVELPADHPRQARPSYEAARHLACVPDNLARGLRERACEEGCTVFTLLLAAFQALLYRHTGLQHIRVGVPMAGRDHAQTQAMVGMFVNTVVIGTQVGGGSSLRHLVEQVRSAVTGAQSHQDLPYEQLVQALRPGQGTLFQVMFNHVHHDDAALARLPGLSVTPMEWGGQSAQVELALDILEGADGRLQMRFSYARELFEPDSVARWQAHYLSLLQALLHSPDQALGNLCLVDAEPLNRLQGWARGEGSRLADGLVHELIARQAQAHPAAPAVIDGGATLSHGQLQHRVDRAARLLVAHGIGPDCRVGLALPPSADMIVGLLAIMKAGAAFVPLDLRHPPQRLAHMLMDSGATCLLTQPGQSPELDTVSLVLTLDAPMPAGARPAQPLPAVHADSLAYVIYTSGSSGRPKGVAVSHGALAMHIQAMREFHGMQRQDCGLLFASVGFDAACEQWMVPLVSGAAVLTGDARAWTAREFVARTAEAGVSALDLPLGYLRLLADELGCPLELPRLERCIIGGEALPTQGLSLARRMFPGARIFNAYGPTEAVVTPSISDVSEVIDVGAHAPIGRPVGEREAWVLDADMQPVAPGMAGELYLGGQGLARGYLGMPALSAERFVAHPLGEPGSRLYRSGDLARWRADGQLEFLGRVDQQIKLRGLRIEPGEIEAVLLAQPGVREAVVMADAVGARLVAYVSALAGQTVQAESLRAQLVHVLPDYMVPGAVVVLDRLPLTVNGKIDQKALPAPVQASVTWEAPQGAQEEMLAGIWAGLLEAGRIGRQDHFFELGGHSLLAIQVVERLQRAGWQAEARDLFRQPRLQDFALTLRPAQQAQEDGAAAASGVPEGCERLESSMLPLVTLQPGHLRAMEAAIPGGAANIQDAYPLTPLQEGILFHHLVQSRGDSYVTHCLLGFDSKARLLAFVEGLNQCIARHDILRTAVLWEGLPQPVQVVCRQAPLRLEWLPEGDGPVTVEQRLAALVDPAEFRLDVRQAPMVRAIAAFDPAHQRWLLQLPSHHLVMDHTALELLVGEVGLIHQGRPDLLPAPVPFRRFVQLARDEAALQGHQAFFSKLLGDVDQPTAPFGLLTLQEPVAEHRLALDAGLARALHGCARGRQVNPATLFHLAWALVLARVSGTQDVVFGTVLFGRMQAAQDMGRAVGMFINTLPVRLRLGGADLDGLLRQTRDCLAGLLAHEHAPLSLALKCSGLPGTTPLFSSLLNYRYGRGGDGAPAGWEGISVLSARERTTYPVAMSVNDQGGGFTLAAQAADADHARRLCLYLEQALQAMVQALAEGGRTRACGLDPLPPQELLQLQRWSTNTRRFDEGPPVHRMFEARAAQAPEAIALVCADQVLCYGELNHRANRLAHALMARGVGPESRVGIAMERSIGMVVALLAVLKAGAAYVPLDPDYPAERLRYMVDDSGIALLLTHGHLGARMPQWPEAVQVMELDEPAPEEAGSANPDPALSAENLVYVIYTSGSTGQPKGAANRHGSLRNRLLWMQQAYGLQPSDVVLQKTPFGFDVSVWEFFWPLMHGARLVLAGPGEHRDPERLAELIERHGVTTLHFVPSMLQAFLQHADLARCASLQRIFCSGEALPAEAQAGVFAGLPQAGLFNLYGPTEAAIDVTHWSCRDDGRSQVPIGRPISQTGAHVLDADLGPAPVGVAGELYLSGANLARGYLHRPALSAERFVASPFGDGERLYRTGDLVRWRVDGELEYLGRIDQQVKIRGLRIELGEVEAQLLAQPQVQEAVAVARQGPGGMRLVGYVSARPGQAIDVQALRAALARTLPEYMVPALIVQLDAMPLNANGKLDRKALPEPDAQADAGHEAPQGPVEQTLARIWAQVLGIERVGRQDNFFALGGDSILSLRVASLARQRGLQVSPAQIFENQSLAAVAQALGDGRLPSLEGIARHAPQPVRAPSSAEARQWFLWRLEPDSSAYHIAATWTLRGALDREALRRSFAALALRHEALRTVFPQGPSGQPQAVVLEGAQPDLRVIDLTVVPQPQRRADAAAELQRLAGTTFDLAADPPWRVSLLALGPDEHRLAVVMHHIISDGQSMQILVQELLALYLAGVQAAPPAEGAGAPPLAPPLCYADYAAWQRGWMGSAEHARQLRYWQDQLGGEHPLLQLPVDHPRRADGRYEAGEWQFELPDTLARQLHAVARAQGTTLFTVLLTGLQILLYRYSGQQDIRVGVPIANRHRPGAEGIVGLLVNTQVLRGQVHDGLMLDEVLARAGETVRGALANQDLPFEQLVEVLQPQRQLGTHALFQVVHNHQRAQAMEKARSLPGLVVEDAASGTRAAQFELALDSTELVDGSIHLSLVHAVELFDRASMERMAGHYVRVLQALADDGAQEVGSLPLLGEDERQALLRQAPAAIALRAAGCLHGRVESQARCQPQAPALRSEGHTLSYAQLNAEANRLAHRLIALGVRPESRVGIAMQRSVEMVVGLLAILKAGGAYVPLDPDYPVGRLSHMVTDSGIGLVLTQAAVRDRIPGTESLQLLEIDTLDLSAESDADPQVQVSADSLAYVIYTSGSTGRPKGAQLSHRNVARLLDATEAWFSFGPDDVWTLFHSYAFDFSVWEIFGALCTGGRLVVVPYWVSRSPQDFLALLRAERVTVLNQTPSAFGQLVHAVEQDEEGGSGLALRKVIFGGEALEPESLRPWFDRFGDESPRLINMYGITETTVHVTYREITKTDLQGGRSPVGVAIPDLGLYVLDGSLNLLPQGVAGELFVAGEGLARGYLNRAGLSAERFIANPFTDDGSRLYRTGDLVRWNAQGELEYLGRVDQQVKIRGFRIELGEVQSQLLAQPEVREAVVLAKQSAGGARLVAYVSLNSPAEDGLLKDRLGQALPDYMVPSAIVVLDALPLTANGKVDRKALPEPETAGAQEYEAPQGELEEALARIWAEVLGVQRVGRHDGFFELGGHSLLALGLLERVRALGLGVQVRTLFQHPRLADFAQALGREQGQLQGQVQIEVPANLIPEDCTAITPQMLTLVDIDAAEIAGIEAAVPGGAANIQDIYPLAPLQEGILFHHMLNADSDAYVTSHVLAFDSRQRLERFVASFNEVIARHDILRTAVLWEGLGEPVQVVYRHAQLQPEWSAADAQQPHPRIDVRQAPMARALAGSRAQDGRWLLRLLCHHLVIDHQTLELLVHEIALIQQGRRELLSAPLPFRRFVAHARRGVGEAEHRAFFTALLGDVTEPTAPYGLLDVQGDGGAVQEARLRLDDGLAGRIRQQARRSGVSSAALFHLAWALVLGRATGRDDVVFGTVLFGRMQGGRGAERAVGLFINTLPVRLQLGARSVRQCLDDTHALLAQLLHHEHASLSLIQRCSGLAGGLPLFSALFNYRYGAQGSQDTAPAWEGMDMLESRERSNYPFGMSVDEQGSAFTLAAQVAQPADALRVCEDLRDALEQLVQALQQAPQTPVCELALGREAEHRRLLDWGDNRAGEVHDATVHGLFEAQARRQPEALALAGDGRPWSYGELNRHANRLAHRLMALGVGPEVRVGILFERCADMVVALLAVLKAGGAYVPLDPKWPDGRTGAMCEDARLRLVLTHECWLERPVGDAGLRWLALDAPDPCVWPDHDPARALHGQGLAYLMYTSGSTGRPKGTEIAHQSICRLVRDADCARLGTGLRMLQFAPLAFDASTFEIWGALCNGGTLVQAPPGRVSFQDLAAFMERHDVRCAWLTAALFNRMLESHPEALARLDQLLSGGEAMSVHHARQALEIMGTTALINGYGPTECTTFAVCGRVEVGDVQGACVPLGRPVRQTLVRVLDAAMQPVPAGVVGELYLGGAGLARGYLGCAGLTAERFVADPLSQEGRRLYRTGDLARWRSDGRIEYLGRADLQMKVRGYRIEAGEIEAGLLAQPGVREAAVVSRPGAGGTRLLAYVVAQAGHVADPEGLRLQLSALLPDYMVPNAIVGLDALPLNANGKLDRRALPEPDLGGGPSHDVPRGETERRLAAIWSAVLGVAQVGRGDNFFELGGHSMAVLDVQARVGRQFSVQLPLRACFESRCLADMALLVEQTLGAADAGKAADLQKMASLLEELDLE
ncbi:non-ribosomal peptide synthetase [Delftia acidovorans]|uniref:non-ribosomal peptide synthetase n=1 Tax=Delftia acidovorans TaxID=80866 RepID=UPI001EE0F3E3|nr:non-ribosomal peptide synthetase [Delftia acidovorans]MCG3782690.1 amino acid adenylation domain-containing protein [Delftia acidovorans]